MAGHLLQQRLAMTQPSQSNAEPLPYWAGSAFDPDVRENRPGRGRDVVVMVVVSPG